MQYLNDKRTRRQRIKDRVQACSQRIKDRVQACILCSFILAIMVAAAYVEVCT